MRRLRSSVIALALAVASCSTQEPRYIQAEFVLQTIAGDPLPALSFENEQVAIHLTADTVRMFEDGTGERVSVGFLVSGGGPPQDHESRRAFTYQLIGTRLEMAYECPPAAFNVLPCAQPPHVVGSETSEQLTVTLDADNRVPQLFARR